jgi:hypothetical protein
MESVKTRPNKIPAKTVQVSVSGDLILIKAPPLVGISYLYDFSGKFIQEI